MNAPKVKPSKEIYNAANVEFASGDSPIFIIVDLFCGFGGTTTGFEEALYVGEDGKLYKAAKVIACVNHDPKAIKSHWLNHPDVKHFEEDIRTLDLTELTALVKYFRKLYPNAYLILWASLECTNFSKAKGGLPRDADSRTLADHMHRYVEALDPDYIKIENVVEFMSWGPLDENGKPLSRKNGRDWMRWRGEMCEHGYYDEWKELNSADYGAYTSRNRLFGCFAKIGLPIVWPAATHSKKPSVNGMYGDLKKWKAVKEVLNFEDEGESIFNRKKDLSEKTLERIYAGLIKYVAKGDTSFISKYYSGRPADKNISIDGPAGTVTTIDSQALVQADFLLQTYAANSKGHNTFSPEGPARTITTRDATALVQPVCLLKYDSTDKTGKHYPPSLENPAPVVITQSRLGLIQGEFIMQYNGGKPDANVIDTDRPMRTITAGHGVKHTLIQPEFIASYYGNGDNVSSVETPAPTIPTKDRCALVQPQFFIDKQYGGSANHQSIEQPAGTIMPDGGGKHALVEAEPFIKNGVLPKVKVTCDCGNTWISTDDSYLKEPCHKCGKLSGSVTFLEPFIMPTNYDNAPKSIEEPSPTITANRKHHYLINPAWGGNAGDIEQPCCVIVARQDKAPLYFVQVERGVVSIAVFDGDSEMTIKIKQFMAAFGLVDIKMRMLRVVELLRIQGFPETYKMVGNQSDHKKFIGNSVHPKVPKAWAEALGGKLIEMFKKKSA